ncbi:MAG: hypothetical protein ABI855_05205 [Bacteroidota bacterium]
MKKIFLVIFLLLNVFALSAQDLIVTVDGDSINARILKIKAGYVYFNYKKGKKIINAMLPPDSVGYTQLDFYPYSDVPLKKIITREEVSNWLVGLSGGFSWMAPATDPSLNSFEKKYLNGLASGLQIGSNVNYFFIEKIGIGLVYNAFLTSNSLDEVEVQFQNGTQSVIKKYGRYSDQIIINYIGPSFNFRRLSRKNTNVIAMAVSIGYTGYRDNFSFLPDPALTRLLPDTTIRIKYTSSTIGLNYDFGYDFGISKHLAIGAGITLRIAVLDTFYETQNGRTQKIVLDQTTGYQSLARADVYLGIRFR